MTDAPRLFLITPPLADATEFAPLLAAAIDAADVACVLLRTATNDEAAIKRVVPILAPILHKREVALLIPGPPRLVARVGGDGMHVPGLGPELEEALETLHPGRIVGAGGLSGRDDAMAAGESGVDYLMFGGPDEAADVDAVVERVAWWAEIFNVPCVGYARDPAQADAVARAGAEFVALCDGLWDGGDVTGTLRSVSQALQPLAVAP